MRCSFRRGAGSFIAMVMVTAMRRATCVLCDTDYDSWGKHVASASHIARTAICRTFVFPERHDSMMQQLWKHIRLDFGYIDDVTHRKEDRRRGRLASTMRHLRDRGVLCHSIPRPSANAGDGSVVFVVTNDAFVNFMLVGEGYARQETLDRVARLMPRIEAFELESVVQYVLSSRRLAWLFDQLDMKLLLSRDAVDAGCAKEKGGDGLQEDCCSSDSAEKGGSVAGGLQRLRQEEKAVIVFSCLGELQMYSRQDRSHSMASKAAAEQLVLNVLGTHVMENIIAELLHAVLQSVVEEGTPVWRAHCDELAEKTFEGTRAAPPSLATSPVGTETVTGVSKSCEDELLALYKLGAGTSAAPPPQTAGRRVWHEVTRELTLELTVPNPVNKTAVFAPAAPRLLPNKKAVDVGK